MIGLALTLLDAATESGGGTFTNTGEPFSPESGYIVGGKVPSLLIGPEPFLGVATTEMVAAWLDRNRSILYGSWLDDGTIYVDAVDFYTDRAMAIESGLRRGEIAIWDLGAGAEIRLIDTDEAAVVPSPS